VEAIGSDGRAERSPTKELPDDLQPISILDDAIFFILKLLPEQFEMLSNVCTQTLCHLVKRTFVCAV
jgi:hypothetical protein